VFVDVKQIDRAWESGFVGDGVWAVGFLDPHFWLQCDVPSGTTQG